MGSKTTVEVSEDASGRVTAVDAASGTTGEGDSVPEALVELARKIAEIEGDLDVLTEATMAALERADAEAAEFFELSGTIRARFREEGVTDEDVDEAIEWARSE